MPEPLDALRSRVINHVRTHLREYYKPAGTWIDSHEGMHPCMQLEASTREILDEIENDPIPDWERGLRAALVLALLTDSGIEHWVTVVCNVQPFPYRKEGLPDERLRQMMIFYEGSDERTVGGYPSSDISIVMPRVSQENRLNDDDWEKLIHFASEGIKLRPNPAAAPKVPAPRSKVGEEKYKRCQRKMLKLKKSNTLPESMQKTAAKLKPEFNYNNVNAATHDHPDLMKHFRIKSKDNVVATQSAPDSLLQDLSGVLDRQGMSLFRKLPKTQREAVETEWKNGDKEKAIEMVKVIATSDPSSFPTVPLHDSDGHHRSGRKKAKPFRSSDDAGDDSY